MLGLDGIGSASAEGPSAYPSPRRRPPWSRLLTSAFAALMTCILRRDLHGIESGKRFYVKNLATTLPMTMGHDILREVVAVDPDAAPFMVQSRQIVYSWLRR